MAQLLVFTRDNTHADPVVDRLEFKLGDVIMVADDSHQFGAGELIPPFRIVNVPGAREDHTYLLEPEPATTKDIYSRSMMQIRRLRRVLDTSVIKAANHIRRQRIHSVSAGDVITRKTTGAA